MRNWSTSASVRAVRFRGSKLAAPHRGGELVGERSHDHTIVRVGDRRDVDEGTAVGQLDALDVRAVNALDLAGGGYRSAAVGDNGDRVEGQRAAQLVEQHAHRVVGRSERCRRGRERLSLGSEAPRLGGPARETTDDEGDDQSDRKEGDQGHHAGQLGDPQRAVRLREREIADHEPEDGRNERRRSSAQQCGDDDDEHVRRQYARESLVFAEWHEGRGQERGSDDGDGPCRRRVGVPRTEPAGTSDATDPVGLAVSVSSSCATTWTSMSGDARTASLMIDPWSSSLKRVRRLVPEDELGGVLGAGERDELRRRVVTDDLVVAATEIGRAAGDDAPIRSSPPAAPRPSLRRTCTPSSSARDRSAMRAARRMRCSADGAPVIATTNRSRVSHGRSMPCSSRYSSSSSSTRSATHSRASSRSAFRLPGPEVVAERRVDPLSGVDVAVRDPAAQRLGGHVDEFDLVSTANDVVGDRLALLDPGDPRERVVERLEVLDVHGGDDVDARVEECLDVLPPLRRAAIPGRSCAPSRRRGRPRVAGRCTASRSRSLELCAAIHDLAAGNDLEPVEELPRCVHARGSRPRPTTTSVPRSIRRRPSSSIL